MAQKTGVGHPSDIDPAAGGSEPVDRGATHRRPGDGGESPGGGFFCAPVASGVIQRVPGQLE